MNGNTYGENSFAADDAYNLHNRVNTLKQIAIEIDGELANQRNMLNAMVSLYARHIDLMYIGDRIMNLMDLELA